MTAGEIDEYLRTYTQPGALRAGFELYRALAHDAADTAAATERGPLPMPVLAIGGASGWGRGHEVAASLRQVADDVHEVVIEEAGHWIAEEQPVVLADHLRTHFRRLPTSSAMSPVRPDFRRS